MLSYRATLDVPCATVRTVSAWLSAHRCAHDSRPHQRAATPWVQAVMVLRWMIEATSMRTLARDAGISIATAYRYLHEALQVISSQAPAPTTPPTTLKRMSTYWTSGPRSACTPANQTTSTG